LRRAFAPARPLPLPSSEQSADRLDLERTTHPVDQALKDLIH
jgi:hypothetical protein